MYNYYSNHKLNQKGSSFSAPLLLIGSALIFMGILIVMFPMILAVITAAFLIGLGASILGFAWKFRRSDRSPFNYHCV